MHVAFLLSGVIALAASVTGLLDYKPSRPLADKEVNVRIDCLPRRAVEFTLSPWSVEVGPGDSVSWRLDARSSVDSMSIVDQSGRWPFRGRPPKVVRNQGARGVRERAATLRGANKYKYAVQAFCVRSATVTDTVLIDPDMIIIGD